MIGFSLTISRCKQTDLSLDELFALNFYGLKKLLPEATIVDRDRISIYSGLIELVDALRSSGLAGVLFEGSGYPYLFLALGQDLKTGFSNLEKESGYNRGSLRDLEDSEFYLVEAWDLS